jgi:hypothetical protein
MKAELERRRERHHVLALGAAEAEAEYRYRHALKVKDFRTEGHPAGLCETYADADAEVYELHKTRLRLAARERAIYEACKDLRELIKGEITQTVNDRD